MSLALCVGLLLTPALASRVNRSAAPAALEINAGGATAEPATPSAYADGGPSDPLAESLVDAEVTAAALGPAEVEEEEEPVDSTTTTTHVHRKSTTTSSTTTTTKPKAKAAATKATPKLVDDADDEPEANPTPSARSAPASRTSGSTAAADKPTGPKSEAEILACIREIESDGNYRAVSPNGLYKGAYQMDDDFWREYGGDPALTGRHHEAPPAQQDAVAARGYRHRGLAPWPSTVEVCG